MSVAHLPAAVDTKSKDAQRYFISSDASKTSGYLLPADDIERERLNLQGGAIDAIFDNRLLWAPVTLKDGDTVLDSGTGSGQWILSLAVQVPPSVNLRGIDLSPRMFPPPSQTPPNVTFVPHSITSLPADWTNSLTLIHQRLLMAALHSHQWKAALSEMYRTLVPGGWVQLFEARNMFVSPDESINKHPAIVMINILSLNVRHIVVDIVNHLPGWLEEAGFINLKIEKRGLPMGSWAGDLGKRSLKASMGTWRSIKEPVVKAGGLGFVKTGEEYETIVDDFERRLDQTPESYIQYWAFTAQKPTTA